MAVQEIWLVRHGESLANVAAARAEAAGDDVIDVEYRDADVPLSPLGEAQSRSLGQELADRGIDAKVDDATWANICHEMETAFRERRFEEGIAAGIAKINTLLAEHFPRAGGAGENELPDRPLVF